MMTKRRIPGMAILRDIQPGFRRVTLEKWRQIKEKCLRMGNSLVDKANE